MRVVVAVLVYISSFIVIISCACYRNYFIPNVIATRFQAHHYCKLHGSNLVNIENQEEADMFLSKVQELGHPNTLYWLGGISYWKESGSRWWYDNLGREMTYQGWCTDYGQPQEPSGSTAYQEPCSAANLTSGRLCWHDYPCFLVHGFVCATPCETDIIQPPIHFGEFCYRFDLQTAVKANEMCKTVSRDRTLVNLDSPQKVEKLVLYYKTYPPSNEIVRPVTWIALKRQAQDTNEFLWNFGTGPVAKWINWNKWQPKDSNIECAYAEFYDNNFVNNEKPCDPSSLCYYICE